MEKMIDAAKTLLTEKPLTIDEKVSAVTSLNKKPKAGQVLYWPNEDGVQVPMDPFGFWESVIYNWLALTSCTTTRCVEPPNDGWWLRLSRGHGPPPEDVRRDITHPFAY